MQIKLQNGSTINFQGTPSQQDIHDAVTHAQSLQVAKPQQPSFMQNVGSALGNYAQGVGQQYMGAAQGVGQQYMGAAQDIMGNFDQSQQPQNQNPFKQNELAFQSVGDVAKATLAPISQVVNQGIVQPAADALSKTQTMQDLATGPVGDKISQLQKAFADFSKKHPNATKDVSSLFNIAGVALGEVLPNIKPEIPTTESLPTENIKPEIPPTGTPPTSDAAELNLKTTLTKAPEPKVMDALQGIAQTKEGQQWFEDAVNVAKDAMNKTGNQNPMGWWGDQVSQTLQKFKGVMNDAMRSRNAVISSNADTVLGDTSVSSIGNIADDLVGQIENRFGARINEDTGEFTQAPGRTIQIGKPEMDALNDTLDKLNDLEDNPTFQKLKDTIDAIRNYKPQTTDIQVNKPVTGLINSYAEKINQVANDFAKNELGDEGQTYLKSNKTYSDLVDAYTKINKALGPNAEKGAGLMKVIFSPSDRGVVDALKTMEGVTGDNIINKATLIKFIMENVGDARQASLLEQAVKGTSSIQEGVGIVKDFASGNYLGGISKIGGKIAQEFQDPIGKARSVLQSFKKTK